MTMRVLVLCASGSMLVGCGGATPERQLRNSFIQQIVTTENVRDVQRNDDDVTFTLRHGEHPDAKWRVHLDFASIERAASGSTSPSPCRKSIHSPRVRSRQSRGARATSRRGARRAAT